MRVSRRTDTFLFSGYARLPQNVSHQAVYKRVGVVAEVDGEGVIVECSSTLVTELARDFLAGLLCGRSVLKDRDQMESLIRARYRGHSQGALIYALRKVFEAVDTSPLVLGDAAVREVPPLDEGA
ncbi:MAG: DUF3870 domain-containing protein [Thermoleophilia bacterium]